MKHLKIYEDYFGNQEYVNKKDIDFFDELWSYIDEDHEEINNQEIWKYKESDFTDKKRKFQFTKELSFPYDSGKNGTGYYKKTVRITKIVEYPKTTISVVDPEYYQVEYEDKKLNVPQEKIKNAFDFIYYNQFNKNKERYIKHDEYEEEQREDELTKLLRRRVKKYNI